MEFIFTSSIYIYKTLQALLEYMAVNLCPAFQLKVSCLRFFRFVSTFPVLWWPACLLAQPWLTKHATQFRLPTDRFSWTMVSSHFDIFGVKKIQLLFDQLVNQKLWLPPLLERKMWVKNAQSCYLACLALSQRPLFLRKGGDKLFSRRRTQLCDNLLRNSWRPFRPSQ